MTKIPTLTSAGWVSDPATMAARLLDYALTTEYSQTQFYPHEVFSIPYIVQQHGDDPYRLASTMEEKLYAYFNRYFEAVYVTVSATDLDSADGRYNLRIDVNVQKDGQRYSLGRLLEMSESKIVNFKGVHP